MNSEAISPGTVFISYAREDRNRVEPLVKYLADIDFDVWWDTEIEAGTSFRSTIQNSLDEAACVVVIWTVASVAKDFVRSEASIGREKGILLPVLLDANARLPVGFRELQYLDLTLWDGTEGTALQGLIERIRSLVALGPSGSRYQATLSSDDWVVNNSERIVSELRGLTSHIRAVGDILASGSSASKDLRGALGEVGKTYRAVNSAILKFITPAVEAVVIDPRPFLEMERGTLRTEIESGRGHCGLILRHYGRYGGLRDWIKDKLSVEELEKVDAAFARLGTADGDLFEPLAAIGGILTNESRAIASLLLAEQKGAARQLYFPRKNGHLILGFL
jgi:hypothetical protein